MKTFNSNCLLEAVKAKIKNPSITILYLPAFLNEVRCPHWMWSDADGEHDFHHSGPLRWYQWIWHSGDIRTVHQGCYKRCINEMIEQKYYLHRSQERNGINWTQIQSVKEGADHEIQ